MVNQFCFLTVSLLEESQVYAHKNLVLEKLNNPIVQMT